MKNKVVLIGGTMITLLAAAYGAAIGALNYSGYCFKEKRYLSDQERIDRAVAYVLATYPPVIDYLNEDASVEPTIERRPPKHPVYYRDAKEFFELNQGCCEVTMRAREGTDNKPSLSSRVMGRTSCYVHVKYKVRYKDARGSEISSVVETYPAISNCGYLWSGI